MRGTRGVPAQPIKIDQIPSQDVERTRSLSLSLPPALSSRIATMAALDQHRYEWTCGGDTDLVYRGTLGSGGFGEVHAVIGLCHNLLDEPE